MHVTRTRRSGLRRSTATLIGLSVVLVLGIVAMAALPAPDDPVLIRVAVDIERPAQAVFDYVTTAGNWPEWHPSSLAVAGATTHPLRVGEKVTEDFLVAGRRGSVEWVVIGRDAPRMWRIEGTGSTGGRAWIEYRLAGNSGSTRFVREMRYQMPNRLAALLDPILARPRIEEESRTAVTNLKRVLEASPE